MGLKWTKIKNSWSGSNFKKLRTVEAHPIFTGSWMYLSKFNIFQHFSKFWHALALNMEPQTIFVTYQTQIWEQWAVSPSLVYFWVDIEMFCPINRGKCWIFLVSAIYFFINFFLIRRENLKNQIEGNSSKIWTKFCSKESKFGLKY